MINNANDLLNIGKISNNNENENNININTMGEPTYQTFGNIEDETSASNNNNSGDGAQPNTSFPGLNFLNPEPINNNNNFLNNFQEK